MTSASLSTWQGARAKRLDRLRAAHAAFAGTGPGRRWATMELNHALVLRLASEFQGFARDLHDEASEAIILAVVPKEPALQMIFGLLFTSARSIDKGNAEPGRLGKDFIFLGINLWSELSARYPRRAPQWNKKLAALNEARNGIAHDDTRRISRAQASGWRMTLESVDRWRKALDGLATGMDHVVEQKLSQILGSAPW